MGVIPAQSIASIWIAFAPRVPNRLPSHPAVNAGLRYGLLVVVRAEGGNSTRTAMHCQVVVSASAFRLPRYLSIESSAKNNAGRLPIFYRGDDTSRQVTDQQLPIPCRDICLESVWRRISNLFRLRLGEQRTEILDTSVSIRWRANALRRNSLI